ncbi:MAG: hypothetical protein M1822_009098 [Bathelium mastoideum]|nr:MAG: hypothetical protein M1822_009098 [Bathelium mastoideum]
MNVEKLYADTPLDPERTHLETSIRLLALDPAQDLSTPLRGTLSATRLSVKTRYEALSYCWGPPIEGQVLKNGSIMINGLNLELAGNLDYGLRRLRFPKTTRTLWVDAICIAQLNNAEKSAQVRRMADIYRMASRVIVWLGEDSEHRDGEFLLGLDAAYSEWRPWTSAGWSPGMQPPPNRAELAKLAKERRQTQADTRRLILNITPELRGKCFAIFKDRLYFRRRWVMQEMCQARQLIVYCGESRASWRAVLRGLELGQGRNSDSIARFFHLVERLTAAVRGRAQITSYTTSVSWFQILSECSQLDCGDERDRIYGLMSFFQGCNFGHKVDYSTPWPKTFRDFTQYCIQHGLEYPMRSYADIWGVILGIAGFQAPLRSAKNTRDEPLPSWIPDWRKKTEAVAINAESSVAAITKTTTHIATIRDCTLSACLGLYGRIAEAEDSAEDEDPFVLIDSNGKKRTDRDPDYALQNQHLCPSLQPGDCLCAPVILLRDMETPSSAIEDVLALVLRPINPEKHSYQLVGLCSLFRFQKIALGQLKPRIEIDVEIV